MSSKSRRAREGADRFGKGMSAYHDKPNINYSGKDSGAWESIRQAAADILPIVIIALILMFLFGK